MEVMPVMRHMLTYEHCVNQVPVTWLNRHELEKRHYQSLEKLAKRGGLSPKEILWGLNQPIASPDLTEDLAAIFLTWIAIERVDFETREPAQTTAN